MSLLHQESPHDIDDAARGEELTKGTSHIVWASIAAAVVVSIAIAVYIIAGEKPPAATGQILEVWAHPLHTQTSGFDASGAAIPQESFDLLLVFTRVRLHNQSQQPIFLYQILTNAEMSDGIHSSYAAPTSQYERAFLAYPEIAQWKATPLSPETTIDPGQTVEGTFVSSFRLTRQQWDARKSLDYNFGFRYLPSLKLKTQISVMER